MTDPSLVSCLLFLIKYNAYLGGGKSFCLIGLFHRSPLPCNLVSSRESGKSWKGFYLLSCIIFDFSGIVTTTTIIALGCWTKRKRKRKKKLVKLLVQWNDFFDASNKFLCSTCKRFSSQYACFYVISTMSKWQRGPLLSSSYAHSQKSL